MNEIVPGVPIIAPIVGRLQAAQAALGLKAVETVGEFMGAMNALKASPTAFVLSSGERTSAVSSATMVTRQETERLFDVVTGWTAASLRPSATQSDLETVESCILECLLGWEHPSGYAPVEYRGSGLMRADFANGLLFWRQSFSFARLVQG